MMSFECIQCGKSHDGQVMEIVLGPPPGNILTAKLMEEIRDALKGARGADEDSRRLKAIVIRGEGKHFSYGASVEEHRPERVGEMLPVFHRLVDEMLSYETPTIAAVSGLCLGGGLELALACSMIFADEKARFGVPEIQLGVFPPVASVLLPMMAGPAATSRMTLTGERFSARTLMGWGVITDVAEAGALDQELSRFIEEQILSKSASSLRFACRATRGPLAERYRGQIKEVERLYLEDLMSTADAVEGIESFLQKRAPKWTNK